jgi:hypothetical protein
MVPRGGHTPGVHFGSSVGPGLPIGSADRQPHKPNGPVGPCGSNDMIVICRESVDLAVSSTEGSGWVDEQFRSAKEDHSEPNS